MCVVICGVPIRQDAVHRERLLLLLGALFYIGGATADLYGRRRIFVLGLTAAPDLLRPRLPRPPISSTRVMGRFLRDVCRTANLQHAAIDAARARSNFTFSWH